MTFYTESFILTNENDTLELARKLAIIIKANDIVTFSGDFGSGKTVMCREIIRYFCGSNTIVISPTYNLLQIYQSQDFDIYHFDLYRIKSVEKILELGIDESYTNNLCLIEWPDLIEKILPWISIKINLSVLSEKKRKCEITSSLEDNLFKGK